MSALGHAVSKVFKGVVGIVKKVWKPLLVAAAIYFTAGAASAYFGAAGAAEAAGGAAALGGDAGAAAGAFGATDAAAAAATGADAGFGAGVAADLGGASAGIAGAADVGAGGAAGVLAGGGAAASGGAGAPLLGESAAQAAPTVGASAAAGGGGSLWQSSLNAAGTILKTPGVPSLIAGIAQGAMQANAINAQLKYMDAHAPGQLSGGVKNAFGGFQNNQNLTPPTAAPTTAKLPQFASLAAPGSTPTGVPNLPGQNSTAAPSYGMPGYGVPGYGQQTQPNQGDPAADPYRQMLANEGLLGGGQQTPFMESPYDESLA